MRRRNLDKIIITGTAAELTADTTIYSVNFELSPTDTADAGKHKLCDDIHTYAQLSFIEDMGGGGGAAVWGTITGSLGNQGDLVGALLNKADDSDIVAVNSAISGEVSRAQSAEGVLTTAVASKGLVYVASILGGSPPTVNGTPVNQLGGTPAWARPGAAVYTLTITGAFTADKIDVHIALQGTGILPGDGVLPLWEHTSANVITINWFDITLAPAEPILFSIRVTVYP